MSSPYVGEIRMFGGNFAPAGWMLCEGQLLAIVENETLFTLIGTTYGGDGQSTFALPDLRGRVPIHLGTSTTTTSYTLAENGGVEAVTVTGNQTPSHTHPYLASGGAGAQPTPAGNVLGASSAVALYSAHAPNRALAPASVGSSGGSQPHGNFQPYLCVNFIISLFGIFPSQS